MSGGGSRVLVPYNVRNIIDEIKAIAGDHPTSDIYGMLQECNMDPNETAQRLLYLDTFHVVKNKRDRKKANESGRVPEGYRRAPIMQGRDDRGSRDARGGRNVNGRKENGVINHTDKGSTLSWPVLQKTENNATPRATKFSTVSADGPTNVSIGTVSDGPARKPHSSAGVNCSASFPVAVPPVDSRLPDAVDTIKHETGSQQIITESSATTRTVGSKSTTGQDAANSNQASSGTVKFSYKARMAKSQDVEKSQLSEISQISFFAAHYSSTVASNQDGQSAQVQKVYLDGTTESSATTGKAGSKSSTGQDVANSSQPASGTVKFSYKTKSVDSQDLETSQLSETSQISFFPDHDASLVVSSNKNGQPAQVQNGHLEGTSESSTTTGTDQVVANSSQAASGIVKTRLRLSQDFEEFKNSEKSQVSDIAQLSFFPDYNASAAVKNGQSEQEQNGRLEVVAPVTVTADSELLPANGPVLEAASSKLDKELEKNISPQPVIIPDHLLVPEALKNQLTFGSLDCNFGNEGFSSATEYDKEASEGAGKPSLSNQSVSSTATEGERVIPQAPHLPENLRPLEDNFASGSVQNYDLSKQEMVPPIAGSHHVQLESPELQSENSVVPPPSGSTPPPRNQSAGSIAQSSMSVPPHLFPFYQPPYPSNYFPYNPYFAPMYLPQNTHQFVGHNGFPQPASTGVKYPVGSPYKPETANNAGGLPPLGILSAYAAYGSAVVGFSPPSGSSAGNEQLLASELKEKNLLSAVRQMQGEDSNAWTGPALGRDVSSLQQGNYVYNLPYSPVQTSHGGFAGMYHPSPTTAALSLLHLSQAMSVSAVEPVGPPPFPYQQQPQHGQQINWNTTNNTLR